MMLASGSPQYDILSSDFHANPNETLARMRSCDPVYWHDALRCWVVTRYDDVQFVIRDARFSVEKGGDIQNVVDRVPRGKLDQCNDCFSTWMVFADPPQHTQLRTVVAKLLSPQVIASLGPLVERVADELLDGVRDRSRMEFVRDFAFPLPAFVVAHLLGIPRDRAADLKRWSYNMFRLFGSGGLVSEELLESTHSSVVECRSYFASLVEDRRSRPGSDLISQLLATDLSPEQVLGTAQMIMVGSNETTTYLLANGLHALLGHPEQMARLQDDPSLIDSAVEELLRFSGPALSIARRALVDVRVRDTVVRAGDIVCCMLHAANFDPARFTDPDRFDIGRADNRHLGLGYGMHFCVGAALTRLETKVGLLSTLHRLPHLRAVEPAPVWPPNLAIRGIRSLDVSFGL